MLPAVPPASPFPPLLAYFWSSPAKSISPAPTAPFLPRHLHPPRFPGITWDDASSNFRLTYDVSHPYVGAGSGYGLLALAWPSAAFVVLPGPGAATREYLPGSCLQLLREKKVRGRVVGGWGMRGLVGGWAGSTHEPTYLRSHAVLAVRCL